MVARVSAMEGADPSAVELLIGDPVWAGGARSWGESVSLLGVAEAARRARGSFAVAARTEDGRVALAVDRFARHTLCWRVQSGELRVGTRADELGASEFDPQSIFDYLFFHVIPSPRTVYRDVRRVPAGHSAVFEGGRMTVEAYARPEFRPEREPSFDRLKEEFRRLLAAAVERELEPGIPACFLSGGTDSSTIAGYVKQLAGEVHTYSIGFDVPGYDEMAYARIAARHFGARHHEYYVTADDVVRSLGAVAASFDQPFGNSSALPAYYCALQARGDEVAKLLAGDGGDELFGGNARYAAQRVYAWWGRVPPSAREALIKPVLRLPGAAAVPWLRRASNYVRDAELGLPDRLHHYNLMRRLGADDVLAPDFLRAVRTESVYEQQREVWRLARADDELDAQLAYDWRYTLAESDLPKVRGACSLAGVSVGYPMLDDALVEFSLRLPARYKLRGSRLRWFFKEALRGFLPDAIVEKTKKGFGLPFGVWALQHAPLRRVVVDSLRQFGARNVVRPEFIETLLERHLPSHPGYYGEMVWILAVFEQWLRRHAPDWRFTPP